MRDIDVEIIELFRQLTKDEKQEVLAFLNKDVKSDASAEEKIQRKNRTGQSL